MTRTTQRLDVLLDSGKEIHIQLEVETECAWSGSLRFTPEPNRAGGPDRSIVFYATGGGDPEEIIGRLLDDFETWEKESGRV